MNSVEVGARKILDAAFEAFVNEQNGGTPVDLGTPIGGIVEYVKVVLSHGTGDPTDSMAPSACKECG